MMLRSMPMIIELVTMMTLILAAVMMGVHGFSNPALATISGDAGTALFARSSPLLDEALDAYPFSFDGKRAMVTKEKATAAFNELARLYGDEDALKIVRLEPRALVFDSSNYAPCLDAWTEQFGLEASQKMVVRNPGLLAVRPSLAAEPAEASMVFSYIVAVTRPLPKLIAAGLLLSIATAGIQ